MIESATQKSKLYFCNNGEFDVSAMLTFGVSAKESSDAIGYFGTGFKYAIAIILRLGGDIKCCTPSGVYEFSSVTKVIRGKSFNIVMVNDREAGFTTHLGSHWEPWQAFRELYANCIDENGSVTQEVNEAQKYDVIIEVDCKPVSEAWENRSQYFLLDRKPLARLGSRVEVYEGWSGYHYFKGVAVADAEQSQFTFNLLSGVDLTEDRTAKYIRLDINLPIASAIQGSDNKLLIRRFLLSQHKGDAEIPYASSYVSSDAFVSTCREMMNEDHGLPPGALRVLSDLDEQSGVWPEITISKVQQAMLDKSISFLAKIDLPVRQYPIKVVRGLGENIMGRAHEGVIYLSMIPFDQGTKQVASTILEEFVHLKYDCKDFDRRMQSWLFDKILSIGEEINGEPL